MDSPLGSATGLRCFDVLRRLLARLHAQRAHPNRELHYDQVITWLVLAFFNPTLKSLRALQHASDDPTFQERSGLQRFSLGSFSEATHVFDPQPLRDIFQELAARTRAQNAPARPSSLPGHLDVLAVDASLWKALPRMARAFYREPLTRCRKGELKGHFLFDVLSGTHSRTSFDWKSAAKFNAEIAIEEQTIATRPWRNGSHLDQPVSIISFDNSKLIILILRREQFRMAIIFLLLCLPAAVAEEESLILDEKEWGLHSVKGREAFLEGITTATTAVLIEGLPHQTIEAGLLASELKNRKTREICGFHFYLQENEIRKADLRELTAIVRLESSFKTRMPGGKGCGGFHPDWCIQWECSDKLYRMLICYGCREAEMTGPNGYRAGPDLTEEATRSIARILAKYRWHRPFYVPKPPAEEAEARARVAWLAADDFDVRNGALLALLKSGECARAPLKQGLNSSDTEVRLGCAEALAQLDAAKALQRWRTLCQSSLVFAAEVQERSRRPDRTISEEEGSVLVSPAESKFAYRRVREVKDIKWRSRDSLISDGTNCWLEANPELKEKKAEVVKYGKDAPWSPVRIINENLNDVKFTSVQQDEVRKDAWLLTGEKTYSTSGKARITVHIDNGESMNIQLKSELHSRPGEDYLSVALKNIRIVGRPAPDSFLYKPPEGVVVQMAGDEPGIKWCNH